MTLQIQQTEKSTSLSIDGAFAEMLSLVARYGLELSYHSKLCELGYECKEVFTDTEKKRIIIEVRPQISCAIKQVREGVGNVRKLHS